MILAVGLPVYFAQGVDRGVLQGQTRFGLLSLSYQAEMWARLLLAVLLVALGGTVNGAVAVIGGVAQVAALCLFHGSLQQVVLVQIYRPDCWPCCCCGTRRWCSGRGANSICGPRFTQSLLKQGGPAPLRHRLRATGSSNFT